MHARSPARGPSGPPTRQRSSSKERPISRAVKRRPCRGSMRRAWLPVSSTGPCVLAASPSPSAPGRARDPPGLASRTFLATRPGEGPMIRWATSLLVRDHLLRAADKNLRAWVVAASRRPHCARDPGERRRSDSRRARRGGLPGGPRAAHAHGARSRSTPGQDQGRVAQGLRDAARRLSPRPTTSEGERRPGSDRRAAATSLQAAFERADTDHRPGWGRIGRRRASAVAPRCHHCPVSPKIASRRGPWPPGEGGPPMSWPAMCLVRGEPDRLASDASRSRRDRPRWRVVRCGWSLPQVRTQRRSRCAPLARRDSTGGVSRRAFLRGVPDARLSMLGTSPAGGGACR